MTRVHTYSIYVSAWNIGLLRNIPEMSRISKFIRNSDRKANATSYSPMDTQTCTRHVCIKQTTHDTNYTNVHKLTQKIHKKVVTLFGAWQRFMTQVGLLSACGTDFVDVCVFHKHDHAREWPMLCYNLYLVENSTATQHIASQTGFYQSRSIQGTINTLFWWPGRMGPWNTHLSCEGARLSYHVEPLTKQYSHCIPSDVYRHGHHYFWCGTSSTTLYATDRCLHSWISIAVAETVVAYVI